MKSNNIYYCIFLSFVILAFSYYNSQKTVEKFTSSIREAYRPYVRNAKTVYNGYYDSAKNNVSGIIKKMKSITNL